MGRTQKALDPRFERLKDKSLEVAEEILSDRTQPKAIRLGASREIRAWLALGTDSWPKPVQSEPVPLSPEEERELIETFKRLERESSDSDC